MSTHTVEVVPVELAEHPNADSLSIVRVRGFQCVVRTEDWRGVELAAYLEPDSFVPDDDERFAFLKVVPITEGRSVELVSDWRGYTAGATGKVVELGADDLFVKNGTKIRMAGDGCEIVVEPDAVVCPPPRNWQRITVRKFRGQWSQGLLVAAPAGSSVGDDVAEALGVTRYEPPIQFGSGYTGGEAESPPLGYRPSYDVENLRRFTDVLVLGEPVIVTEKIHGANARFAWQDDRLRCGSRTTWKRESETNLWWQAARQIERLGDCCRVHKLTLYGEVFGQVQDLKYGAKPGDMPRLAFFDGWSEERGAWISWVQLQAIAFEFGLPLVPELFKGPFDAEAIAELADGASLVKGADNIREGLVVKPEVERQHDGGRVQFKLVSNKYLERSKRKG